jgi:hypothetical protein
MVFTALGKGQFAQDFRWSIKLAILLKTRTFKKSNFFFVKSKHNSPEQYCQQN